MGRLMNGKTIARNVSLSVIVQLVSLSVSFVLNFAIPRFVDEYQYSYWQAFVLYLGYVGILHFGLLDGIVLRYSQYDFEELDKSVFRSQFKILLSSLSLLAVLGIAYAIVFTSGVIQKTAIFVCVGIITKNVFAYNSYLFQITNRISYYAKLIIVQRLLYGVLVILLLFCKVNSFEWYCIADLVGDFAGIVVAAFYNKGMFFGKSLSITATLSEWKTNVSSGILLMLANWSAMLLLGSAKMIVQWHWDDITFGKIAFSFSVSNLFLTFITAVSIVLFPALKRMDKENLPKVYGKIRGIIAPVLLLSLILYYPGCIIIGKLLPNYKESLVHLGVLLPVVLFTSKVNLLTNNFLKAYRAEKQMLFVNLFSIVIAFIMFYISAYIFNSLNGVLICIVIAVALNSILSEWLVMRIIKKSYYKEFIAEVIITFVFIVSTSLFKLSIACVIYCCAMIVYSIVFRENLKAIVRSINTSITKRQ